MDKTNLSQRKYIYRVYIGGDNKINVERYPIAYINGRYVYYIRGYQQMLDYTCIEHVRDSLDEFMETNAKNGKSPLQNLHDRCFWNVSEKDPNATKETLLLEYDKARRERAIANAKDAMERTQREAERAKQRYESLVKG